MNDIQDVLRGIRFHAKRHPEPYNSWADAIEQALRGRDAEIEDKEASLDMMRSRLGERETLLRQCREKNKRIEARAALAGKEDKP